MSESEVTPSPHRRADDAIRWGGIVKSWHVLTGVAVLLVLGGSTFNTVKTDIVTLQADVATLKTNRAADIGQYSNEFAKLNRRITHIDQKLGLLICAADRTKCAADALSMTGPDDP